MNIENLISQIELEMGNVLLNSQDQAIRRAFARCDQVFTPPTPSHNFTRQEILEEAIKFVTKDRSAVHGEPEDNFHAIAMLQTAYLQARFPAPQPINLERHDVAVLNILQKIARIVTTPGHRDHWTDTAGYAACGGEIAIKERP